LPISARSAFDNTGNLYDPHAIFTNGSFDVEKYRAYSPLFLTPTQALAYALGFASFTAIIVHSFRMFSILLFLFTLFLTLVVVWYRHDIKKRFSRGLQDERDVHSRLMQAYPEAPNWWYLATAAVSMTFILIAIHLSPTQMPIWGVLIAASFGTLLSLPIGIIQAITNQQVMLNVIGELFGGYILPNRPVANMIFKAVSYIVPAQAMLFTGDLKLGHYMKIPPRIMFIAQSLATVICCFVVTGVQQFLFAHIPDICTPDQKSGFICPSTHTFATASLVWGGIGPQRLFSPGAM
jgi:OPT family oligopeptide transporter